jgi:hypothetical protein
MESPHPMQAPEVILAALYTLFSTVKTARKFCLSCIPVLPLPAIPEHQTALHLCTSEPALHSSPQPCTLHTPQLWTHSQHSPTSHGHPLTCILCAILMCTPELASCSSPQLCTSPVHPTVLICPQTRDCLCLDTLSLSAAEGLTSSVPHLCLGDEIR